MAVKSDLKGRCTALINASGIWKRKNKVDKRTKGIDAEKDRIEKYKKKLK